MADKRMLERVKAEIERRSRMSVDERWDALVSRGAIDQEGRVLLRGPDADGTAARRARRKAGRK